MCEGFHKLQVEELNKEVEYIDGVNEDLIQTYEQERLVLTPSYLAWEADHENRVKEHLKECTQTECIKLKEFYKSKGIYQ
jgi:tRNA nucleotidyltransferase (CCA-adding enzyme)